MRRTGEEDVDCGRYQRRLLRWPRARNTRRRRSWKEHPRACMMGNTGEETHSGDQRRSPARGRHPEAVPLSASVSQARMLIYQRRGRRAHGKDDRKDDLEDVAAGWKASANTFLRVSDASCPSPAQESPPAWVGRRRCLDTAAMVFDSLKAIMDVVMCQRGRKIVVMIREKAEKMMAEVGWRHVPGDGPLTVVPLCNTSSRQRSAAPSCQAHRPESPAHR